MTIDAKAVKMETASEVRARLDMCITILGNVHTSLRDMDIDEDIMQDFDLAVSRMQYMEQHVRRIQLKLRKQ